MLDLELPFQHFWNCHLTALEASIERDLPHRHALTLGRSWLPHRKKPLLSDAVATHLGGNACAVFRFAPTMAACQALALLTAANIRLLNGCYQSHLLTHRLAVRAPGRARGSSPAALLRSNFLILRKIFYRRNRTGRQESLALGFQVQTTHSQGEQDAPSENRQNKGAACDVRRLKVDYLRLDQSAFAPI